MAWCFQILGILQWLYERLSGWVRYCCSKGNGITLMIIIVPLPLEEEEACDQRKGGCKGTLTFPQSYWSGVLDAWGRRKYEPRCGVSLIKKGRGGWD